MVVRTLKGVETLKQARDWQTESLRYSRLKVCVTTRNQNYLRLHAGPRLVSQSGDASDTIQYRAADGAKTAQQAGTHA